MSAPIMHFTNAGLALRNRNSVGEKLTITRIAMGDGTLSNPDAIPGLSALIHEVISIEVTAKTVKDRHVVASGQMDVSALTNPFRWRELGVFAYGEDGVEVLYGYLYLGEDGDVVSPDGKLLERTIAVAVVVGDATNVEVSIDPLKWSAPMVGPAELANSLEAGSMLLVTCEANGATEDEWAQDPVTVKGTGAICRIEDNWLHLKAGLGNGNNAAVGAEDCPAVFVNETASIELREVAGRKFLELTFTLLSAKTDTRFGVYLNYKDPGNGFFIGVDPGGWYWQMYSGGDGSWYSGSRVPAPEAGEQTTLQLEWEGTTLLSATVNGAVIFENLDFSTANNERADRVGLKLSTWGGVATQVEVVRCNYTNQEGEA